MPQRALILFAHGARDPNWATPFKAVAQAVSALQPDIGVGLAFLEFMSPDLPTAAAQAVADGAVQVDVVPLFLGAGGHVRKDLPVILEGLRAAYPQVQFSLHPAIGEMSSVIQAMAQAAVSQTTQASPTSGGAAVQRSA